VVHGSTVSFLSSKTLLNQSNISSTVVSILNNQPSAPTCTTPPPSPPAPPKPTDGTAKVTVPLHAFLIPRRGLFPKAVRGDFILTRGKARVFCRKRRLPSTAFPGRQNLRVTLPRCKVRPRVKGRGLALLVRTRGTATIQIQGNAVSVTPNGISARSVVLELQNGGRFSRIPLAGNGTGTLPSGSGPTTLRVTVAPRHGRTVEGSGTVSR
jgi:hypothetical protein